MELFDALKAIFTKEEIPDEFLKKHSFMLNRLLSIRYPIQALGLSMIGRDPISCMMYWISAIPRSTPPSWIYTKTRKRDDKVDIKIPKDSLKEYMMATNLSERDVEIAMQMDPKALKKSVGELMKQLGEE